MQREQIADWPMYGHSHDQAHYSPLHDISESNVSRLGLTWWFDIPGVVLATSVPLEVNGTLYFAVGYSVVRAVDARTGRLLWSYDPDVPRVAGRKLRIHWGIRGLAYWDSRVYVGTHDGRLICLDAKTGALVWSTQTTQADDLRVITGPPLAFNGKVLIGHAGSELVPLRGYVTAYDAYTGRQLWRFFTVPGDPAKGFENPAMEMAAKTWTGEWWKFGGGGAVWNAMTYDPELNRVYIGTSNGSPWNRRIRSPAGGDNLFTAAIVALDADTGAYAWHYQTNPGDVWDYDAVADLEMATLSIEGKKRRVLMQASKNGFYYVIDRDSGHLLSAEKFAKATWAERIDAASGRPIEAPKARYGSRTTAIWPGAFGAHGSQAMAFNPKQGLAYIPTIELPFQYSDGGIDRQKWAPNKDFIPSLGVNIGVEDLMSGTSSLVAWDPIAKRPAWKVNLPGLWNGAVATTGGNLVFQGRYDGKLVAYAANSGKELWSFDAHVGIIGAPISYKVGSTQYVSVIAGFGGQPGALGSVWDARTQPRRLLTFALDGKAHLPSKHSRLDTAPVPDPTFLANSKAEERGAAMFGRCAPCHGYAAIGGGTAPDLRTSSVLQSKLTFESIVKRGTLLELGMPRFEELTDSQIEDIRQYLRSRAVELSSQSTRPKQDKSVQRERVR